MTDPTDARAQLFEQVAFETAAVWAQACYRELALDGRPVEGGWPGTMREARTRATEEANRSLRARSMPALTYEETGRLARMTYDEARRSWQLHTRRPRAKTRSGARTSDD